MTLSAPFTSVSLSLPSCEPGSSQEGPRDRKAVEVSGHVGQASQHGLKDRAGPSQSPAWLPRPCPTTHLPTVT